MKIYLKAFGALFFLISTCASANDSTARVGAGGLELLKTDNIQMVSEVLEMSTAKIKVTYHFLNTSQKDIKTTVAFPMPAFSIYGIDGSSGDNQRPLDSFQIFVGGVSVAVQKNHVFLGNDIDVTDKLRKIGLSEAQIFNTETTCGSEDFYKCKLSEEQIAQLKQLKTNGDLDYPQIKETAYWEQTFPAGKDIEVVHEYKPFVGLYGTGNGEKLPNIIAEYGGKEACASETFKSMKAYSDSNKFYWGDIQQVEYILGTGRNWEGPIKKFKLIIKKEKPEQIVSLCFPGKFSKTSPTTLEFSQSNYAPQDKLIVYFYDLVERIQE